MRNPRPKPGGWEPFASLLGMVRLVLCVDWDPIGVFGTPQTLDEYDRYAASIALMLEMDASEDALVQHLESIVMCRTPRERHVATAKKLLRMHDNYVSNTRPHDT